MTEEGKRFFEFVKFKKYDEAASLVKSHPSILSELNDQGKFFADLIAKDEFQQARAIAMTAVKPEKNKVSVNVFLSSFCCCLFSLAGGISFGFMRGDIFMLMISTSFSLAIAACFINQCGAIWAQSADNILHIAKTDALRRESIAMDSARSSDEEMELGEVDHVRRLSQENPAEWAIRR